MLKTEAEWLRSRIALWPSDKGSILNVGSSDRYFRTTIQPWIDSCVISPAMTRGLKIINQDLLPGAGVDIEGDLSSAQCQEELRGLRLYGLICSNVFEHVTDRKAFAKALCSLIPYSGRALITVPYRFPYHADPIDTGFRPDVSQLLALFPDFRLIDGRILSCGRLADLILANPGRVLSSRMNLEKKSSRNKKHLSDWLPYILKAFKITCIEVERQC